MGGFGLRTIGFRLVAYLTIVLGLCGDATPSLAAQASSISQWGITWSFDRPHEVGQYVNGDWWVVGPVTIVSVSPAPSGAQPGEDYSTAGNQFGDAALQRDDRMRHGSMVVLRQNNKQGYDSRVINFDPSLSVQYPYTLPVDRSLISTVSLRSTTNNPNFVQGHFEKSWSVIKTAAVLTSVAVAPPADAFRPPYAGTEKPIYRTSSLRRELLPRLDSVSSAPSFAQYERYFERVWLDHSHSWVDGRISPLENMPGYGREYARLTSMASLLLSLDVPDERKEALLIRFVQLGIDLHGVARNGGTWPGEGGIWSGRKWPIVFASIVLGDPSMLPDPRSTTVVFAEDQQTYYGQSFKGDTVLFQMGIHHGIAPPYEEKNPSNWGSQDQRSEDYRQCCTSLAWIGTALAARHMRATESWSHDAFFDYADRWMEDERGPVWDAFVRDMWAAHRSSAPAAALAPVSLKWVWQGGPWVANPHPGGVAVAPLPTPYLRP